jgi:quercetin dioxygenase-like cupin family protein
MDYKFIPDLAAEFAMPKDGIMSRVLHKDERLNVTLFGFSTGQELSTHSAPTPALLYFLQGEADVRTERRHRRWKARVFHLYAADASSRHFR